MNRIEKMQHVWQVEAEEIRRLGSQTDFAQADVLIDLFLRTKAAGKRFFFGGVGTSGAAAKKLAHSFSCIEFPAAFLSPGDAVHGGLGMVQSGDAVVLLSKGGSTREIINLLEGLKKKGAAVVGVTENPDSILGRNADVAIKVKIQREPDSFNMLATASTMAVIAFFDAVAILLMEESGYTREQFAIIHPGGAVGDRLLHGGQ